jgi:hypothetical protein
MDELLAAVNHQLSRQADRKTSLEQRAITVITTSSALATLVFTVVTAIAKIHGVERFVKEEHIWIQFGVGTFLFAALAALAVIFPVPYGDVDPDSIKELKKKSGSADSETRQRVVSEFVNNGIDDLKTAQTMNTVKSWILEFAFFFEVMAVLFLLIALVEILARV